MLETIIAYAFKNIVAIAIAAAGTNRPGVNVDRVTDIAAEVHEVVSEEGIALPFTGPAKVKASEAAVMAVMVHESGLDERVERCESPWKGANDHGTSWGLGQVKAHWYLGHTKDEVCADRKLQIRVTLNALANYHRAGSVLHLFQGYNQGFPEKQSRASSDTRKVFDKLAAASNLRFEGLKASFARR